MCGRSGYNEVMHVVHVHVASRYGSSSIRGSRIPVSVYIDIQETAMNTEFPKVLFLLKRRKQRILDASYTS